MAKKIVYVTTAQILAARKLVERSATTGRYVSPAIRMIANARQAPRRSEAPASGGSAGED